LHLLVSLLAPVLALCVEDTERRTRKFHRLFVLASRARSHFTHGFSTPAFADGFSKKPHILVI